MNYYLYILLFFYSNVVAFAQSYTLKISGINPIENYSIDSLNYKTKHENVKSIDDEINKSVLNLTNKGYIDCRVVDNIRVNDTTFNYFLNLGKKINYISVLINRKKNEEFLLNEEFKKDTIKLAFEEIASFLKNSLYKLEKKGYAFANLKLSNISRINQSLFAKLELKLNKQKILNSIVVKQKQEGLKSKFPRGHLTQVNRKYKNATFNKELVKNIHTEFEKFSFVNQVKYPEILFSSDSTKIYVYLEKQKSNTFDGFVGFSNNEKNKLVFNGYLDLALENILQAGEQFSIFWKSDGNNQKTFISKLEIPYIFNTPLCSKGQIHLFKQDSLFQNTKTEIELGYYLNYNTRLFMGLQSTESSAIQNSINPSIFNYKNSYITSNFEFFKLDNNTSIFSKKMNVYFKIGSGNRIRNTINGETEKNKQYFYDLQLMRSFYLDKKNCINIKILNYYLKSDFYVVNELYRFGGINSIRGFAENSFQANFLYSLISEYRFIVSPDLYLHSITDFASFEDITSNTKENLLGIGFGIGVKTNNGLLRFILSTGKTKEQKLRFNNTFVNLSYNVKF